MTTAIGPQGPNFSTTRPPTDAIASGGTDTWVVNCSAPGATDGTYLDASFFNVFIAQLRETIRSAGVALDDTDDLMLYHAIQAIVAEALTDFFTTTLFGARGIRIRAGEGDDEGKYFIESNVGTEDLPLLT